MRCRCSCPTWLCLPNTLLLPADAPDAKLSTVLHLQDSMLQQLQEYNELAPQLDVHKPQHPYLRPVRKLPPESNFVSFSSRQPQWWCHFVVNTDSMACDGAMLCCHACGSARQVSPLSASSRVLTRARVLPAQPDSSTSAASPAAGKLPAAPPSAAARPTLADPGTAAAVSGLPLQQLASLTGRLEAACQQVRQAATWRCACQYKQCSDKAAAQHACSLHAHPLCLGVHSSSCAAVW